MCKSIILFILLLFNSVNLGLLNSNEQQEQFLTIYSIYHVNMTKAPFNQNVYDQSLKQASTQMNEDELVKLFESKIPTIIENFRRISLKEGKFNI
jgi:hypothetical protein